MNLNNLVNWQDMSLIKRRLYNTILLSTLAALVGCYSPQALQTEAHFPVPDNFSKNGQAQLSERWWLEFHDEQLNKLMSIALEQSFTLQAAFYRLKRAEAAYRVSTGNLLPSLDADNKFSSNRNRVESTTSSSQNFSLGLTASYEVDLWGRISSLKEAAEFDMLGSEMDLETAAITLSSQVASTWYQLSEQRNRLQLLERQHGVNDKALEIIKLQFKTGKVGIEDVLQQQQLLESNMAEQARLQAEIDQSFHALNILIGEPPNSTAYIPLSGVLFMPQDLPATGLPAELLNRRPDVKSAFFEVEAANARLAAAIAAQYPALSISASINTSSASTSDLFDDWFSNIAANLITPLFDGGKLTAEVEQQEAISKEKLNLYNQTMLNALSEVEDALSQETQQRKYIAHVDNQLALATQSMEQIKNRYLKGTENYQRVLTALVSMQNLQQTQLKARQTLINYRIELCRSLAGGWHITQQMN